jgi:membrane protein implicated in regulation of membrane protease activity
MGAAEAMFFAHPFWVWIALGGVFLIGELMSGSGWLLWPAGAAGTTAIATLVSPMGWPLQIVLFVAVAIVATYVGRRFLRPADGAKGDINDPSRRLVGKAGEATDAFKEGLGRVFVDGKEWAAELEGGGELAAKTKVEVTQILGGARLKVKAE